MNKTNWQDVVLAITERCNSRCRMCSIWRKGRFDEMPVGFLANLPENLHDINLSGGEPFLHSDLPGVVAAARSRCRHAKITISTNGFATELIIGAIKKILLIDPEISIALSLDGIGVAHDDVRGISGGFEKVIATMQGLKSEGVKNLRFAFTLGDYNIDELSRVYHLSKRMGVEFTLAVVHSGDNFFGQENAIEKKSEMIKSLDRLISEELSSSSPKRWARAFFAYGIQRWLTTGKRILPDYSGVNNFFIDSRGSIYACDVATDKIGQLGLDGIDLDQNPDGCPSNWMICTARPAMKRHLLKVASWITREKIRRAFFS